MYSLNRSKRWNISLRLTAITTLLFLSAPIKPGLGAESNKDKITRIEKVLFFKTYSSESLDKRVERLEKRFFGEPLEGELEPRIDKIYNLAKPQIEAAEKSTAPVVESSSEPEPQVKEPTPEDKEREARKAAVQKAREEEIESLMKDGISFWKAKDARHAMDRFDQVIRLDPRNSEAFFSRGVIFEANGQLDKALASYNQANFINPDRLDFKEAITVVKKALEKGGSQDQMAVEAAQAFRRKEYLSALDLYKQLEQKYPKNAKYKYNIGTIYLLIKSPEQALGYYEKAKKLDPKQPKYKEAYKKLADTLKANSTELDKRNAAWDKRMALEEKHKSKKGTGSKPGPSRNPVNQTPYQMQAQMPAQRPGSMPGYQQQQQPMQQQPMQQQPMQQQQQPPRPITPQAPAETPALVKQVLASLGLIVNTSPNGIVINTVGIGSRAAKSGIKVGDVILSVNGVNVQSTTQLALLLSKIPSGQKGQLLVKRQGQVGQIMF